MVVLLCRGEKKGHHPMRMMALEIDPAGYIIRWPSA